MILDFIMIKFKKRIGFILFIGLAFSGFAKADVLLLVHGFQGSVYSWENSGVVSVLDHFGWKRAGVLVATPVGLRPLLSAKKDPKNKIISLQLNTEIPLSGQASIFTAALRWVNDRYPSEKIIIAGHSLGGVVARLSLVREGAPNVKALITIASPHHGTVLAYQALDTIGDPFPINKLKEFFAGSEYEMLTRSKGLLHDIVPTVPGKVLHWLNTRQHPPIKYYSIVRTTFSGALGDIIVPGYSQDMSNVAPIGRQSTRIIHGFKHELTVLDGYALVNILGEL